MKKRIKLNQIIESLLKTAEAESIDKILLGGIIINANAQVLLLKRAASETEFPNIIELPSGHMESNETAYQCLCREVREETGLEIKKDISPIYIDQFDYISSSSKKCRQFNFLVEVDNLGALTLNPEEHSEYRWCNKSEAISWGVGKVLQSTFKNFAVL